MLHASRGLRVFAALSWLGACGCTTLRELPREQYASAQERKRVEVDTQDGQHHEFEFARFGSDTLTGYVRRDTEGPVEEYTTVTIPLDTVSRLAARRVDWYRTGLIGGAVLAGVILAALTRDKDPEPLPPEEPCPVEPCGP